MPASLISFPHLAMSDFTVAGANTPVNPIASYPGRPEAATVGIPGASAVGSALVTVIAVHEQTQLAHAHDAPDLIGILGEGMNAKVGRRQRRGRHP